VLLTVGIDLIALAAIVMLVDVCRFAQGQRFFTILGRNPMAIYLFSELFVTTLNMVPMGEDGGIYDWLGIAVFQSIAPGPLGSLLCAFAYTMACWAVGWAMDRKGLILRA
jgi:predicted acyltransferase